MTTDNLRKNRNFVVLLSVYSTKTAEVVESDKVKFDGDNIIALEWLAARGTSCVLPLGHTAQTCHAVNGVRTLALCREAGVVVKRVATDLTRFHVADHLLLLGYFTLQRLEHRLAIATGLVGAEGLIYELNG